MFGKYDKKRIENEKIIMENYELLKKVPKYLTSLDGKVIEVKISFGVNMLNGKLYRCPQQKFPKIVFKRSRKNKLEHSAKHFDYVDMPEEARENIGLAIGYFSEKNEH